VEVVCSPGEIRSGKASGIAVSKHLLLRTRGLELPQEITLEKSPYTLSSFVALAHSLSLANSDPFHEPNNRICNTWHYLPQSIGS
jgi:hypothetical protein